VARMREGDEVARGMLLLAGFWGACVVSGARLGMVGREDREVSGLGNGALD